MFICFAHEYSPESWFDNVEDDPSKIVEARTYCGVLEDSKADKAKDSCCVFIAHD
jgi:hypothetical protein